jgi:hypothetical protein
MRPDMSWMCVKLALPMMRLAIMRPATRTRRGFAVEEFGGLVAVFGMQLAGHHVAAEVIREGNAGSADQSELLAALANQPVFVLQRHFCCHHDRFVVSHEIHKTHEKKFVVKTQGLRLTLTILAFIQPMFRGFRGFRGHQSHYLTARSSGWPR